MGGSDPEIGILLMNATERLPTGADRAEKPLRLAFLICLHIIICCVSLVRISIYDYPAAFSPPTFHIFFDPMRWYVPVIVVAAFAPASIAFFRARFSFGYFIGFYLYTMILGYLWLNCFTDLDYDRRLAGFSAAASAIAFLLPALFISSPVRQIYPLTTRSFDLLLACILALGIATIAVGALYNFRIVAFENMYEYRAKLNAPASVNYLVTIFSSTLLPFAFAGFLARKAHWRAALVLVLLLSIYPIMLNKTTLFAPLWLVGMLVLSKFFETRIAVILSLLLPILLGLILITIPTKYTALYFATVNFRMIAVPSVAMEVYNDFFSRHDLTYLCQISFLKQVTHCPYQDQLSVVMERNYKLGNFNGSLFTTEGIASVGVLFAPVAAFLCGLAVALGNRLSAGVPAGFIVISAAVIPQVALNVPLTTVLLTHGTALLFLLWYVTPRAIFEPGNALDATGLSAACSSTIPATIALRA
jgi:hypothetical protein